MITKKILENTKPGEKIATGYFINDEENVFLTRDENAKKVVKFECIRGEGNKENMDWACYCEDLYRDFSKATFENLYYDISEQGDKVPKDYLRKFLVLDDFAFDHYRK